MSYQIQEWGEPGQPTLVMLHGWGDCGATFQFLVDALQADWHVIAPDWRGFGDSGHNDGSYWFPDYLADLDALLTALLVPEPCTLIGHSMGGNVAALFAGVFPERVAKLINVEGFGLPDSNPADAPLRYRQWLEAVRGRRQHPGYENLAPLVARIRQASPQLDETRASYVAGLWAQQTDDTRWHLKADIAHRWPNPILYRRAEAQACWQRITARVLLVAGANTEYRDALALWQSPDAGGDYPGATLKTIEDAGHMLHFEQPQALAATIEAFLRV
ncbi:MAG: alpha/beta hydrolase [Woeseia sp.]